MENIKRHNEKLKNPEIFHDVEDIPTALDASISNEMKKLKISKADQGKWKELIDEFMSINSHTNLSAIRDPEGIRIKHIQDSLEINKVLLIKPGSTLCDIGTGGGFPLLPIAINNPRLECIGIDSTKKKIDAINEMIGKLKIPNVQAIRTRAEEYKKQFDYVTARAVGYIDKLLPRVHHLVKKGGRLVLYKQYTPEESQDIIHFGKKYRFIVQKRHKYQLFDGDIQRIIYVLKKI